MSIRGLEHFLAIYLGVTLLFIWQEFFSYYAFDHVFALWMASLSFASCLVLLFHFLQFQISPIIAVTTTGFLFLMQKRIYYYSENIELEAMATSLLLFILWWIAFIPFETWRFSKLYHWPRLRKGLLGLRYLRFLPELVYLVLLSIVPDLVFFFPVLLALQYQQNKPKRFIALHAVIAAAMLAKHFLLGAYQIATLLQAPLPLAATSIAPYFEGSALFLQMCLLGYLLAKGKLFSLRQLLCVFSFFLFALFVKYFPHSLLLFKENYFTSFAWTLLAAHFAHLLTKHISKKVSVPVWAIICFLCLFYYHSVNAPRMHYTKQGFFNLRLNGEKQ